LIKNVLLWNVQPNHKFQYITKLKMKFNFSSPKNKQTYHALDELDEVALNQMHGAGYLEMPGTGEAG
jgi:hypothetical protein